MSSHISHVSLYTNDLEKAAKFYTANFGFKIRHEFMFSNFHWITLELEHQPKFQLTFFLANTEKEKECVGKYNNGLLPILTLQVDDCDVEYARLVNLGAVSNSEPGNYPWGRVASIKDYDGNLVCLFQSNETYWT